MSRAKKGVASEGKVQAQQEEAEVNSFPFPIEKLRELLKETKDETIKELKEETKKLSDRIQALELKQQQISPSENAGSQGKFGERDEYATEAGGKEITPLKQRLRQAASSSYGPSLFFQLEQPRQQPPPPPSSQTPPLPYQNPQPFSAPAPFLAGRQHQPLPIGTRGVSSAGEPITMPWKLSPPVFNGDSLKFRSFCKEEATTFADSVEDLAMPLRAAVKLLLLV